MLQTNVPELIQSNKCYFPKKSIEGIYRIIYRDATSINVSVTSNDINNFYHRSAHSQTKCNVICQHHVNCLFVKLT